MRIANAIKRTVPRSVLHEDLVAAGMVGLWDAVCRHNPKLPPAGFEWYAGVRIRGAIKDEMRVQDWIPRRSRAVINQLYGDKSLRPRIVLSIEDVNHEEIEWAMSSDGEEPSGFDQEWASKAIAKAVDALPPRERAIVRRHYFDGLRLTEIAREFRVSPPRISQLLRQALDRLGAGGLRAKLAE
jgi:RNA polymerase sigma factor for flagellar operon FliA